LVRYRREPGPNRILDNVPRDNPTGLLLTKDTIEKARLPKAFASHGAEYECSSLFPTRDKLHQIGGRGCGFGKEMDMIVHDAVRGNRESANVRKLQ